MSNIAGKCSVITCYYTLRQRCESRDLCSLLHPPTFNVETLSLCTTSTHSLINQAFEVSIFCLPQATQKRVSSSPTVDKTASCRRCTMLFQCWQSHCLGTNLIMWWGPKQRDLDSPSNPHSSPGSGYTPLFKRSCMTGGTCMRVQANLTNYAFFPPLS